MFNFSWSELALIGAVALVVIGPKDLPRALRTAGQWARKARTISREFQNSIEQMVREAELDEARKELEKVTSVSVAEELQRAADPTGSLAADLAPHKLLEDQKPAAEGSIEAPPHDAAAPQALLPAPERPPVHTEPLPAHTEAVPAETEPRPATPEAQESTPARGEGTS